MSLFLGVTNAHLNIFTNVFFFQFTAKITDFLYSSCFAPQWASMLLLSGSNVPL